LEENCIPFTGSGYRWRSNDQRKFSIIVRSKPWHENLIMKTLLAPIVVATYLALAAAQASLAVRADDGPRASYYKNGEILQTPTPTRAQLAVN
jgi:hypothetical protein